MIYQTPQQRANTLEALFVMWPSVPPENVIDRLCYWRDEDSFNKTPSCKTAACFGGWCAVYPKFVEQGISTDEHGMPHISYLFGTEVGDALFGSSGMFAVRGDFDKTDEEFLGTNHELVTHRLQWLLANSEVRA